MLPSTLVPPALIPVLVSRVASLPRGGMRHHPFSTKGRRQRKRKRKATIYPNWTVPEGERRGGESVEKRGRGPTGKGAEGEEFLFHFYPSPSSLLVGALHPHWRLPTHRFVMGRGGGVTQGHSAGHFPMSEVLSSPKFLHSIPLSLLNHLFPLHNQIILLFFSYCTAPSSPPFPFISHPPPLRPG